MADWQPGQYLRYKKERTQPTIDLVNRIDVDKPKRIIDIGCGPGNSTAVLRGRWPDAEIVGLDSSEAMLEKARADQPGGVWVHMGAGDDLDGLGKFDIVFSNAALQWMPDHEVLLANFFQLLSGGGALAFQVPYARRMPAFATILEMIRLPEWAGCFSSPPEYPKHYPADHFYDIVCGLTGDFAAWQTDYLHVMAGHDDIVEWYKGAGLRPFLDMLPGDAEREGFCREYRERIALAYPVRKDGKVVLPFTRIFFVGYKSLS